MHVASLNIKQVSQSKLKPVTVEISTDEDTVVLSDENNFLQKLWGHPLNQKCYHSVILLFL